jgi:CRISPR-associated protein Cmr6
MSNAAHVPMMFRAAAPDRCQLQYIDRDNDNTEIDVERWVSEWIEETSQTIPHLGQEPQDPTSGRFQSKPYKIAWRFVSNSGADPSIILPVIGAKGFPHYPGSSMKGAFRNACQKLFPDRVTKYCGDYCGDRREDLSPGMLRFHGAYPTSTDWTKNLIDLAHPQSGWQVKTKNTTEKPTGESAFVQVSLHQPELRFGISSTRELSDSEWQDIWQIWQAALFNGIGCRVCAGYGKTKLRPAEPLNKSILSGQGAASTLIDKTPEFRPNMFRAAVRGHALRIFGGLGSAETAESLVNQLFGGIPREEGAVWGLLNLGFYETQKFDWEPHGYYKMPYYTIEGELTWLLTQPTIGDEKIAALKALIENLMRFSMLLGGFGKTWRRVDHRQFYRQTNYDKLIGCHWSWSRPVFRTSDPDEQLDDVGKVINNVQRAAAAWMKLQGHRPNPAQPADWRESWCRDRAQVWGRVAEHEKDSVAIRWFHEGYDTQIQGGRSVPTKQLKTRPVAGCLGSWGAGRLTRIGRLWHRMYPVITRPEKPGGRPLVRYEYLELLTFFPDMSEASSQQLSEYLNSSRNQDFIRLW